MKCFGRQGHRLVILIYLVGYLSDVHAIPKQRLFNNMIPAIFVFGDSTVDPGNNDYIPTIFKGNFPPYGRDFADHAATGRFTNGRLPTDYLISYIGIKDNVPPYLNQSLSMGELMTGVSFASAGTGYDPLTASFTNVITLSQQLQYFRDYQRKIESKIGLPMMNNLVEKSIFLISAGTNDFALNYFSVPLRKLIFSISAYQQFVLGNFEQFIQGLVSEGAKTIAVVGLPPMGCLPIVITLNTLPLTGRRCIESFNSVARVYNTRLQIRLEQLQSSMSNSSVHMYYVDIYSPLQDMIQNRQKYGFEDESRGCCGSGLFEATYLCNPKTPVCPDASKFIFWDSIHPSDKAYNLIFQAFRPLVDSVIRESTK